MRNWTSKRPILQEVSGRKVHESSQRIQILTAGRFAGNWTKAKVSYAILIRNFVALIAGDTCIAAIANIAL